MVQGPALTRESGQRSLDLPSYLLRLIPPFATPEWMAGQAWRNIVANQPVAILCQDTLIAYMNALDWKVQARDSTKQDELQEEVDYYTRGFECEFGLDFPEHIEWICQDALTIPFGGASEVIREGDAPEGRVLAIVPIDGVTLFPTLNKRMPVGQRVLGYDIDTVFFPYYAINRLYLSPRPQMKREGWGMAPPEKVFLSLEMLRRGDIYYANLLLDTPEAGILDLMDMEKDSAEQWIESFRSLMTGIDAFKIPVLYEHEKEVKWIPFTRPPGEIMFGEISAKQAAFVAAAYGLSLGDLGVQDSASGGETLSGTIRQERKTRKSLLVVLKKKAVAYFNRMMPEYLQFTWIDYDDELNVQKGRAFMSAVTAISQAIDKRVITPKEGRLHLKDSGIITISIPEDVPMDGFDMLPAANSPTRPGMMADNVTPAQGGHGEPEVARSMSEDAMASVLKVSFEGLISRTTNIEIERLIRLIAPKIFKQVKGALKELSTLQEISRWNLWHEESLYGEGEEDAKIQRALDDKRLDKDLERDEWWLLDIDEEEIAAILAAAYVVALTDIVDKIANDLYIAGILDSPVFEPNVVFRLINEQVLKGLSEKAAMMVTNLNDGTKYYLRRMLVSGIRQGLTDAEIIAKIRAGVDINEILDDNIFIQRVSDSVKTQIRGLTEYRIRSIVSFEVRSIEMSAWLKQFKSLGLTQKRWKHFGSDIPCTECQINLDAGDVPLDYKFESVFGKVQVPPAHPHEHCEITYNLEELETLIKSGKFKVWTGD